MNKTVIIILSIFALFGCKKSDVQKNVENCKKSFLIKTLNEDFTVCQFKIYEDNKGFILLEIEDLSVTKKISSRDVSILQYKNNDTIFTAQKVKMLYGRNQNLNPFFISIDNTNSKDKILSVNIENKIMFPIGTTLNNKDFFINEGFKLEKIIR